MMGNIMQGMTGAPGPGMTGGMIGGNGMGMGMGMGVGMGMGMGMGSMQQQMV